MASNLGYAHVARRYENKLLTSEAYCDIDDRPVATAKGYAALSRTYDAEGRMLTETYFGTDGKALNCVSRYANVTYEYDSESNVIRQSFDDETGSPVVAAVGYAEVRREYSNKKLVREEYYGADGNPLIQPAGHAAITQEWDGDVLVSRSYLDADGHPMLRSDGYAKAVWLQDESGTWNMRFNDLEGSEVALEGKNLTRDVRFGEDGWSEWMTPNPNTVNYCFNIGYTNLGSKAEGDVYTSQVEIEFRNVTATEGQAFRFRAQDAQDGRWFTGNVWNSNLVSLSEVPADGVYQYISTVAVSGDMVSISTFNIGFRCDYWGSGSFRVRNVKIEKGETGSEWEPGV